ncbi:putative Ig domain-containing protein [Sulfurovum sp.]|uniref:putative Ig domain-containing protein n=1 Tax=Sulfurovum sp. TaxID=1969726 RepID=UPI00356A0EAA
MNLLKMFSHIFAVLAVTMFFTSSLSAICVGDRQVDWITTTSFYTNTNDVSSNKPDYNVIDVTTPGILNLTLTDLDVNEDLIVTLYADLDCGGAAIWSGSTSGVGTTISTSVNVISAGVYTLQIYGSSSGQVTDYRLDGTFIASTNPPIMGTIPNQFFEIGVPFSFSLQPYVTQTEGHAITAYDMTGLPGWAILDTATGIVTGTPDANGTYTINASAYDVDGWSNIETFLLDSTPLLAPIMGNVPDQDVIKDQAYSFDLSPYVTSSTAVTYYVIGSLPAGLTLDSATGIISGVATVAGTVTLQFYVEDTSGVASNTDEVVISVTAAGAASDLDLLKISSTRLTEVGTTVMYSITIANTTSSVLTDVNITDILQTFNYDLLTATVGTLVVPSPDVNITIIESNTFTCSITALDRIECNGGTIDKRSGPHGVPGLQRIYYSITTPLTPNPAYLLNTVSVNGSITEVNASVLSASGIGGYSPPTTPPIRADMIEGGLWTSTGIDDYNSGAIQVIQTKVSGDNVLLTAVHLDGESNATAYTPANSAQNFLVMPYISDGFCGSQSEPLLLPDGNVARFLIPSGQASTDLVVKMPDYANRVRRIVVTYLDFDVIAPSDGDTCAISSSTNGNLPGLPQCVNSEQVYYNTFGLETYARCAANNGEPCTSNNGGYSCGPGDTSCTGYNPVYDNQFGCLMCTLNIQPECSSDNFALRPAQFDINSSDASYPDLLRAGQDYGLTINAMDKNLTVPTIGYDQAGAAIKVDNLTKYYANNGGTEVAGALMSGDGNFSNAFAFNNGVSSAAMFSYSDVGDITIHMEDRDWAYVDIINPNDTTTHDCAVDGAYVCGDKNATFIPDHFDVAIDSLHDNNVSDKFTYLSNDLNMSAKLGVTITAKNAVGVTTRNFKQPAFGRNYYENNVTVGLRVFPVAGFTGFNVHDINTSVALGFDLGEKQIAWDEENRTKQLLINFPRTTNTPVNPFILYGNRVNVDVNSTYTGIAPEGTANINGTKNAENDNATFVYGRVHAPRYRAMCGGGAPCPANVTFFYEFYADKDANATLITQLLGGSKNRSVDSVNWYRNSEHNTSTDGNVTWTTQNIPGNLTQGTFIFTTQTTSSTYNYDATKGFPYKATLTIPEGTITPGSGTQSWLIYDKYTAGATQVQSPVEYYGPGTWTSTGDNTTHSTSNTGTAKKNTNRRIRW